MINQNLLEGLRDKYFETGFETFTALNGEERRASLTSIFTLITFWINICPFHLQAIWELMQKAQAEGVLGQDFKLPSSAREPAPQAEAEEITPEPGFVVKTADEESGTKIFINVCGSDKVKLPAQGQCRT